MKSSVTTACVIQHIGCETPGRIADALQGEGVTLTCVRTFAGEPVPKDIQPFAGLVIMGGPMGVYEQERYAFLRDELRLIEQALRADIPILGVCLGSQLLAAALGAPVGPAPRKEIGWFPVTLTSAARAADFLPLLEPIGHEVFTRFARRTTRRVGSGGPDDRPLRGANH